jgi:hypothetical protein
LKNKLYVNRIFTKIASMDSFRQACFDGNMEAMSDLKHGDVMFGDKVAFVNACANGHLHIVTLIVGKRDEHHAGQWFLEGFNAACEASQFTVVAYLNQRMRFAFVNDVNFGDACGDGRLTLAKNLHILAPIDVTAKQYRPFRLACAGGHIHIVRWLLSIGAVPPKLDEFPDMRLFLIVCRRGHLAVAKWLFSKLRVGEHTMNAGFKNACAGGHLHVLEWIRRRTCVSSSCAAAGFHQALLRNNLPLLTWLYKHFEVDVVHIVRNMRERCVSWSDIDSKTLTFVWRLAPNAEFSSRWAKKRALQLVSFMK